jgi:ABC-type sugar transport system ATPase subunit
MTGIHRRDQGEMVLNGEFVRIHNSQDAQAYGIAAIYQEPMVYPDLNVAEDIFISHQNRGPFVRWGKMYDDAGRMGSYTNEKDPTRDEGLRVLMGPFTVYTAENVEASAQ